jgi:hypothetical protein
VIFFKPSPAAKSPHLTQTAFCLQIIDEWVGYNALLEVCARRLSILTTTIFFSGEALSCKLVRWAVFVSLSLLEFFQTF